MKSQYYSTAFPCGRAPCENRCTIIDNPGYRLVLIVKVSISPTSFPRLHYILRVLGIECCPGTQILHFRGLLGNPKPPKPETPNPELLNPERLNAKTLNPQILSPKTLNRRPWDVLTPEP